MVVTTGLNNAVGPLKLHGSGGMPSLSISLSLSVATPISVCTLWAMAKKSFGRRQEVAFSDAFLPAAETCQPGQACLPSDPLQNHIMATIRKSHVAQDGGMLSSRTLRTLIVMFMNRKSRFFFTLHNNAVDRGPAGETEVFRSRRSKDIRLLSFLYFFRLSPSNFEGVELNSKSSAESGLSFLFIFLVAVAQWQWQCFSFLATPWMPLPEAVSAFAFEVATTLLYFSRASCLQFPVSSNVFFFFFLYII